MSDASNNIVITAMGALTPVGANVEKSCAAIKAGINRINEHSYYECTPEDPEWDDTLPLFVADVPAIDPFTDGPERLMELALPVLNEVMGKAKLKRADLDECGLMLSLPQPDAAIDSMQLNSRFVPELCKRTGLTTLKLWKTSQTGHTGVFALVQNACQKLANGDLQFCVVGGVDSYLLEARLDVLDAAWRIRTERNVDGFIPGEAAVMLMLETQAHATARGATILARITHIGEGTEPEAYHSKKNSTGTGLSTALDTAIPKNSSAKPIQEVYCSLNGESYYAFEWGLALVRLNTAFEGLKHLHHPAENCGDVGAATGGLLMACAAQNLSKIKQSDAQSLLWTASDNGHRMALTLQGQG